MENIIKAPIIDNNSTLIKMILEQDRTDKMEFVLIKKCYT